ncbi:MAG: radical SAM protein [Myxococcales bacterium]|nr:radical SAM protein [Myxococcales bacterium]
MTQKTAKLHAARRAAEVGEPLPRHGWRRAVAVYPSPYEVAMSNLGYQWLFHALASAGLGVARAVWPDAALLAEVERDTLRAIDDDRAAADADVWFVSLSFENDLVRFAELLRLAGLAPRAAARDDAAPLIVAGGVVPMLNPEPTAALADVCLLGEGEAVLRPFLDYLRDHDPARREDFLAGLRDLPGAYVGRYYQSRYAADGRLLAVEARGGFPARVAVPKEARFDPLLTRLHLRAPSAAFGDTLLIETARGCVNRCRFCAAGHLFLPFRPASPPASLPRLGEDALGLVGSNVSGHPELERWIAAADGRRVTLSSIRRGALSDAQWARLTAAALAAAALAPEAGTARLRAVVNKPATDKEILAEVARAAAASIRNIKLYYLIGLPTETAEDRVAIVELTQRCRDAAMVGWKAKGRAGKIIASVNPFIPKPQTPFQWHPYGDPAERQKQLADLRNKLRPLPNVEMQSESPREAVLQALLSLGDRRTADLALRVAEAGNIQRGLKAWRPDYLALLTAQREFGDCLPWDHLDIGVRRDYLEKEYENALAGKTSPPCNLGHRCRLCGAC